MGSVGNNTSLHSRPIYRGVAGPEYVEDIFNPNTPTFMSVGVHGTGLYFTANKDEATGIANLNAQLSGREAAVATVTLDLKRAKIIDEQELIRKMHGEGISADKYMDEHGYNVIYDRTNDYYVIRDKRVLKRR